MFLELFAVLSAVVALGVFQYKTEVKRAERIINEIRKEMEQEKEENSNN
jgi:hypothetical protein